MTLSLSAGSIVNLVRSQSHEAPSLRSWFRMMPPCFSFHCQRVLKIPSRVSEFLSIPSALSFWTTLASVAIDAWSVPGTQQAFLPLHPGAAYQHVLYGFVQHVPHVQHSGHVRRRDDDRVGFPSVGRRVEKIVADPVVVPLGFDLLRVYFAPISISIPNFSINLAKITIFRQLLQVCLWPRRSSVRCGRISSPAGRACAPYRAMPVGGRSRCRPLRRRAAGGFVLFARRAANAGVTARAGLQVGIGQGQVKRQLFGGAVPVCREAGVVGHVHRHAVL